MPVILSLGRLRHEDHELEIGLSYIATPCQPGPQHETLSEKYLSSNLPYNLAVGY